MQINSTIISIQIINLIKINRDVNYFLFMIFNCLFSLYIFINNSNNKKQINQKTFFYMNQRQISSMFSQNKEDFNPIQTFGTRQSINPTVKSSSKDAKMKKYLKPSRQLEEQDDQNYRGQTRIRLLTSFQQSYLQSISQPNFTDPDQGSDLKPANRSNTLSYSETKRPNNSVEKYLVSDPNDTFQNLNQQKQIINQVKERRQGNQAQKNSNFLRQIIKGEEKKNQQSKEKIKNLSRSIQESLYNLSVQQRLYDYLISRIDDRGRLRKQKDNHKIIEHAIEFMDSGEQFMKDLLKLKKMHNQS